MTVLYGSTFEDVVAQLPAALDVMEESGYRENLEVTWVCENYDPYKPDSYTFKCILPEDKISNIRDFDVEIEVRLLHEVGRGMGRTKGIYKGPPREAHSREWERAPFALAGLHGKQVLVCLRNASF